MDTTSQDGQTGASQPPGFQLQVSPEQVLLNLEAGQSLDVDQLLSSLEQAGVTTGIDDEAIASAVGLSQQGQAVVDNIIARQIDPTPSKPARIEQVISMGQVALPGDVIQRLIPGARGETGTSVTGDIIEAPSAPVVKLQHGDNTQEVGFELQATAYGVIKIQGGHVHVVSPLNVSHDKLTATLDIHPQSAAGTATTVDVLQQCLQDFGVTYGIQTEQIEEALQTAQAEQTLQPRVEVAKGCPARAEKPADYEFTFTINGKDPLALLSGEADESQLEQPRLLQIVQEDAVLCRERPATPAQPGKSVFGEDIKAPPAAKAKIKAPVCGDNVLKEDNVFKATITQCGYADLREGKLCVDSPVTLSDDNMLATLCVYPSSDNESVLNKETVLQLLKLRSITFGIDEAAIEQAISQLQENDARQVCMEIARGQEECQGEDAKFDHFISVEKLAGEKKDDGTIDFRERGTIINVKPGDAIGKKVPPTAGRPQVNLLGDTTPAKGGRDIDFQPGEHCELRDDGIFYATDEGALMVKDALVHVTDIYQHAGDVDLQSGNLLHKKGAIEVSGSVLSGFEVKANGHVIVKQNVDNGRIVAGGDVAVGAGVVQPEKSIGYIHAMGNVSVKFAQNAKILSYADIEVGGSAMNCQIHAKGKVNITKGKGCIIGGVVKSAKQIRAKQIGSEAGSLTLVEIEIDPKIKKSLAEAIQTEEELVEQHLGDPDKLAGLIKEQKQFFEKSREDAAIIVEGAIFPGTTVKILNVAQTIKQEKRRCKITLTPNKKLYFGNIE